MQFTDKHTFDKPAASVIKMFSDKAYFERKYKELGFKSIQVLEHSGDGRFEDAARFLEQLFLGGLHVSEQPA